MPNNSKKQVAYYRILEVFPKERHTKVTKERLLGCVRRDHPGLAPFVNSNFESLVQALEADGHISISYYHGHTLYGLKTISGPPPPTFIFCPVSK